MQKTLTEIKTLVADIGPGVLKGFRKDDVYICICIVRWSVKKVHGDYDEEAS